MIGGTIDEAPAVEGPVAVVDPGTVFVEVEIVELASAMVDVGDSFIDD